MFFIDCVCQVFSKNVSHIIIIDDNCGTSKAIFELLNGYISGMTLIDLN